MSNQTVLEKEQVRKQVLDAMNNRHATKFYDESRKISGEDFNYILEAGRLSPSSLGSEPWKFLVVQNPVLREKLMDVMPGAVEKLKAASHFVIILSRKNVRYDSEYLQDQMSNIQHYPEDMLPMITDQYKSFQESNNILDNQQTLNSWSAKQTYIALGNMLTAASLIGIDSSPMEGFFPDKVDAILEEEGLIETSNYTTSVLAAFGYRKEDPARPKTRKPLDKVVQWA